MYFTYYTVSKEKLDKSRFLYGQVADKIHFGRCNL